MGVTVTMLASGSRGNCALVASTCTRILVDAGISGRETFKRMKALGEDPHGLSAILITHEHSDHIYGLATLAKRLRVPVFMTGATHQAWARAAHHENGERPQLEKLERFESWAPVRDRRYRSEAVYDSARCGRSGGLHRPGRGRQGGIRHRSGIRSAQRARQPARAPMCW